MFKKVLLENGAEFSDSFISNLLRIIQLMKPPKSGIIDNDLSSLSKNVNVLATKFPGLAIPNEAQHSLNKDSDEEDEEVEEKEKNIKPVIKKDVVDDMMAELEALAPSSSKVTDIKKSEKSSTRHRSNSRDRNRHRSRSKDRKRSHSRDRTRRHSRSRDHRRDRSRSRTKTSRRERSRSNDTKHDRRRSRSRSRNRNRDRRDRNRSPSPRRRRSRSKDKHHRNRSNSEDKNADPALSATMKDDPDAGKVNYTIIIFIHFSYNLNIIYYFRFIVEK